MRPRVSPINGVSLYRKTTADVNFTNSGHQVTFQARPNTLFLPQMGRFSALLVIHQAEDKVKEVVMIISIIIGNNINDSYEENHNTNNNNNKVS